MKGVIKNMKEQFLNLSGLTELVTYIKLCIVQHKMIIPRASFSLFPKTGDENNIYIDTSTNSIYRWNDSDKSFVLLAKPPRNISISEGKNNGQITLKVDEIESNATVHGLKSAAFSNASSFASAAQGAKADSAVQSITIAPGTNNGTVKITVNGVTTDNIKVAGLGSAAFSDIAVFAPAKHTHSKSDVGLGNVDNTADIDKSVKYAGSSGSSNTIVYTALTNTNLNTLQTEGKWYYAGGGNTCTNVPVESAAFELYVGRNASGWRYQQFTVTSGEIYIRVFDSSNWGNWRKLAFTSDTVTAASSVPWSGITGKPSTFAPSSHNHTIANITDIGNASVNFANSSSCPQGFALRQATATWGNQTGTVVTDWHTSNGGDIAFRDNSGQLNVVIDGFFYQNEGRNLVLDSGNYSNYAATKNHTHTISNITNLQTTLDGKSNTNHTHDLNPMINTLANGTSDPVDADYYIAQYAGGGSTTTTYYRRPHSALWNYIKSKANSVYQPKGSYAASSHTHDDRYYTESEINTKLASKSDTSHTHNYVVGSYTGNGGQQKPNYFGTNKVGFLMMNTTVNGDSNYKDWIIMDCYGGNDVGGSVALGVNRQKLAAYIMRSAAERSSWAESAELLHTLNYTSYTVTKTGSGASGTWGISISGNATTSTKLATARSINGTNFDGSGNITTATWGTARTLTIGNTGKSVNGGGNVSWSLSEIGAAASNHTHSYLPLSGGAMTGNISYRGSKATYKMIEFIDNSSDEYGNGIAIGGGGLTIIGGGESADVVKSTSTRGGDERLILANDGAIDIYTNCQNGIDKATHITIDNTGLYSGTAAKANSVPWSGVTSKPSTFTPASHTHNYAGSSSAGGSANSAVKLDTSAGSATQPVYFSGGKPVACSYTLGKSVPSNAVFTDTNTTYPISYRTIDNNFASKYRTQTKGNTSAGDYISTLRCETNLVPYAPQYGSGLGWGRWDTHGYLYMNYNSPQVYVGAGNADKLNWAKQLAFADHTHSYTEITNRPTLIKAVSKNGYWGMADHDGSDSNWIRTTTAGIIPYQSGGAGSGHCGLGTSSWYFSNAYIDTVNCVNASVSGHIDVGGYIQSSNLINTYFEYQSNRGSVDWRFGAATGTGDENFFGFYDTKTGKIPLALDGNYGNIYVGFNVGSYESPTTVGVYLGGQVAGNRAFIYNGDSYQGSIWIQTRLDGSWKWFSLGRVCSTALSDIRLKGDIRDTEVEDATKVIESMKIRSFERKDSHKKYKIGFIADELEQLDPNLVDGGGEVDGHPYYKSVNNLQMLAYVVKGMQELNSKVTILEKENKRLKQKLNMCN